MEVTMEKIALIALSLAVTSGVMAIILTYVPPAARAAGQSSFSVTLSVVDKWDARWFTVLVVTERQILSVSSSCTIDYRVLRPNALVIYGYCDGTPATLPLTLETSGGVMEVGVPLGG